MKKIYFALIAALAMSTSILAQQMNCGFDEQFEYLFEHYPEQSARYWASYEAERFVPESKHVQIPSDSILRIPTVVHIFHNGGIENISDAQVLDMIRVMNEDFRRTHADTALTDSHFVDVVTDMQIEFILARLDPDSNCTNGIVRHRTRLANDLPQGFKQFGWDNGAYLNIYLAGGVYGASGGGTLIGYGMPPGFNIPLRMDGIMNRSDYAGSVGTALTLPVGSRGGSVLSHEAGHYVGLMHTFQDGCLAFGDNCDDTPPVDAPNFGCVVQPNTCSNDVPDLPDMSENYMDYSDNECMLSFTKNQKTRAFDRLTDVFGRRRLLGWVNLQETGILLDESPCAPMPDFMIDKEIILLGDTVRLYGNAYNGTVTTRIWDFPGAAGTFGTNDSVALAVYESPGVYNFSYTVGNSLGTNTKMFQKRIVVLDTVVKNNGPIIIDFDQPQSASELVYLASELGNSFQVTNQTSVSGPNSLMLDNWSKSAQAVNREYQEDLIYFGPFDGTALSEYTLSFDYAMAGQGAFVDDRLRVYISSNGSTWNARGVINAWDLITDTLDYSTQPFFPSSTNSWETKTISLALAQSMPKFWIRFEYESKYGNNFFLDNIFLGTSVGLEASSSLDLRLYPNPATEFITLANGSSELLNANFKLLDLTGRVVYSKDLGRVASGQELRTDLPIGLSAGSYLLRIESPAGSFTKPWVIQ